MQISRLSSLLLVAASAVAAAPQTDSEDSQLTSRTFGWGFSASNFWGAPIKPWHETAHPGWYLGSYCNGLPKWTGGSGNSNNNDWLCGWPWSSFIPQCHKGNGGSNGGNNGGNNGGKPPVTCDNGYEQKFNNYTTVAQSGVYQGQTVGAATIDNANYLTYGLVDNLSQCEQVCNEISNCVFINLYQEFNSTIKDGYGKNKLTCAAYKACSGTDKATNYGGQDDPTYIVNSEGYCKGGACA